MTEKNFGELSNYHLEGTKDIKSFHALAGFKKTEYYNEILEIYDCWISRNIEDVLGNKTFKTNPKIPYSLMNQQNKVSSYRELFGAKIEKTPHIEDAEFYKQLFKRIPNLILLLVDIYPKLDRLEKIDMIESKALRKTTQFASAIFDRKDLYGRICKDLKEEKEADQSDYSFELYLLYLIGKNYLDLIIKIHKSLVNETDLDLTKMTVLGTSHSKVYSKKLNKTISYQIMNKEVFTFEGFSYLLEVLTSAEYNLGLIKELLQKV